MAVAFGDPATGLYGLARTSVSPGDAGGMGILFAGGAPVAVRSEGVRIEVVEPLAPLDRVVRRRVRARGRGARAAGRGGRRRDERATSSSAASAGRSPSTASSAASTASASAGTRGAAPDWSKLALARTVSAWLDDRTAVALSAVRSTSAKHHADEEVRAHLVLDGTPRPVADPRLSTTYDADGRQIHAGPRAVGHRRRGRVPAPRRRRGRVRHDDRPRAACAWTARSSSGAWRAGRASGATTSCAARA